MLSITSFHSAIFLVAFALVASISTTHANEKQTCGDIVLVGGALEVNNKEIWGRIIQAGGGSQSRFGILTTGSIPKSQDPHASNPSQCDNSECNTEYYANILKRYGAASAEWIPVDLDHRAAAEDQTLAAKVANYTGFFIGGGDQSRYSDVLIRSDNTTDTAVLGALRTAVQRGAGVAGTSAGTAIQQGGPMVTSGEGYYGVRDGSYPELSKDYNRLTYRPEGGFGLFNTGLIDTHFGVRGREGRMIRLLSDTNNALGFGIDEDTALVASGETLTVMGTNQVHIFNLAQQTTRGDDWRISGVRWSLLQGGDSFDMASGHVQPASEAQPYDGEDQSLSFRSNDVFSSPDNPREGRHQYEMVRLAQDLIRSRRDLRTSGKTYERKPLYEVRLSILDSTLMWKKPDSEMSTFQDIIVDILPAEGQ